MVTIVTRASNGGDLSNTQVDTNITNLNQELLENIVSATAGSSTAYTFTNDPTLAAHASGRVVRVRWDETCGDDPTLAVDGLTARSIRIPRGYTTADIGIDAGDILVNDVSELLYEDAGASQNWFIQNPYQGDSSLSDHYPMSSHTYFYNDDGATEPAQIAELRNSGGTGIAETDSAWVTCGPTDSGATNELSALDSMLYRSTSILATIVIKITPSGDDVDVVIHARPGGSSWSQNSLSAICDIDLMGRDTSQQQFVRQVEIPVNPVDNTFDISVNTQDVTTEVITPYYRGFRC
jgi:hypothetical protein